MKAEARKAAFAARKLAFSQGPCDPALLLQALAPHAGKTLAGYMPMRTEADPLPAMRAHPGPVCVPVILAPATPLRFARWTPETDMVPGDFGALIPAQPDWLEPDLLIVPLLAFDRRLYRLGYGGGFYDRTLAQLRATRPVTALGFAYAGQELPEVPTDATDQPLDLIVTETAVFGP